MEMLTAPNYRIKCETKMDCVKQSWMKRTTNKQTNNFLAIFCRCCCFWIVPVSWCCFVSHFFAVNRFWWQKFFFHHSFYLFLIFFSPRTIWHYYFFFVAAHKQCFCLRFIFAWNLSVWGLRVFVCCVRLIIFDSTVGKVKRRRRIYEKCSQHIAIEAQSK